MTVGQRSGGGHDQAVEEDMLRQLQTFGAPEHVRAYVRDQRLMENHGARISALETNFATMQVQLQEIAKDAGETRAELSTMLKHVSTQVTAISQEQNRDAGRREAAAERAVWVRWSVPTLIAIGLYLAANFVEDVSEKIKVEAQP